nr:reverse transcriptase domain-containing protein [Tanacetum cinerariifolium]
MVGGGQGNEVNDGVDGVPDFSTIITQQLQNLLPTILAQVATKVAIKGTLEIKTVMPSMTTSRAIREAAVGMLWEDFKTLTKEEFYLANKMQKLEIEFLNHAMVGADHAAYTDRFHELARNGSLKKNPEKRRNGREPNRDRNVRDWNKRTRTGKAFATTTNPVRREYNGIIPKCISCNLHHPPKMPCQAFINCGRPRHMEKDCRVAPRIVEPSTKARGNRPNQVVANNRGQGHGNNGNQARRREFMLGAEEAPQDSNIVTGIEPNELGFSYKIKIASGQLVEIDKVIGVAN